MTTTNLLRINPKAPHVTYRLGSGEKVPGVTTILNVLAKQALLGWYAAEEREGILSLAERLAGDKGEDVVRTLALRACAPVKDNGKPQWFAETKRDKAADIGTLGHAHVEAFLKGCTLDPTGLDPDLYSQALSVRDRFCEWWGEEGLSVVHSEHVMVSEAWRCGGTADIIARDSEGRLVLWDLKSSKPFYEGRPYDEMYGQTAAYARIYSQITGEDIHRIVIARTGKTLGDKGNKYPVSVVQRAIGEDLFKCALGAYEAKHRLTQV